MKQKESPAPIETTEQLKARARRVSAILRSTHPRVMALKFSNPFELLIATILSAQCTDDKVNSVTPGLFARFPNARALAGGELDEIEQIIHSTGFFRQKAKSIKNCSLTLAERFNGEVPEAMDDLTSLPGVGRKTANVVRACAMDRPGLIVDTHFKRVTGRLGLTSETDPDKIEFALARLLPEEEWSHFSNATIWHGRTCCTAAKPKCSECPAQQDCPFGSEKP